MNTMTNVESRPHRSRIITIYSRFHTLLFLMQEEMDLGTLTTLEEEAFKCGALDEENRFFWSVSSDFCVHVYTWTCWTWRKSGVRPWGWSLKERHGVLLTCALHYVQPAWPFQTLTPTPLASQLRVNNCQGLLIKFSRACVKQVPFSHTKYVILMDSSVCWSRRDLFLKTSLLLTTSSTPTCESNGKICEGQQACVKNVKWWGVNTSGTLKPLEEERLGLTRWEVYQHIKAECQLDYLTKSLLF